MRTSRQWRKAMARLGLALFFLSTLAFGARHVIAGGPAALPPLPPNSNPEFPSFDNTAWLRQRDGLMTKLAAQRLAQAPEDPDTIAVLAEQRRIDDGLRVLRTIVDKHPDRIARAFEVVSLQAHRILQDRARNYAEVLRGIAADARTKVATLPREQAALTVWRILPVERQVAGKEPPYRDRLVAFTQEYAGTAAALSAERVLLRFPPPGQPPLSPAQQSEAEDTFVRAHPGTIEAANALYDKGSFLAHNADRVEDRRAGADPTERFLRVLEIANELESGKYPPCEWVSRAPALVSGFFAYRAKYAPQNLDRQIDTLKAYAKAHWRPDAAQPFDDSIGYILTARLPALYAVKGERVAATERVLAEFEREATNPIGAAAVRHLRATFYLAGPSPLEDKPESPAERDALLVKARDALGALGTEQASAENPYPRRALATLAALHFYHREYAAARDRYTQYLERYPRSEWAWVATLRLGRVQEELGDRNVAAAAYRAAATRYENVPPARVLGRVYAARISEGLDQFDRALADYRRALESWDDDYGPAYTIRAFQAPRSESAAAAFIPIETIDTFEVRKRDLPVRIAQLTRALDMPGGTLLERGRWLLTQSRWQDARAALDEVIARYAKSPAAADARGLLHRARFEAALDLANADNPKTDAAAALRELDALVGEAGSRSANALPTPAWPLRTRTPTTSPSARRAWPKRSC